MPIRVYIFIIIFFSTYVQAHSALAIALVPDTDREFDPMEYNSAKIRQACIEVHGED